MPPDFTRFAHPLMGMHSLDKASPKPKNVLSFDINDLDIFIVKML